MKNLLYSFFLLSSSYVFSSTYIYTSSYIDVVDLKVIKNSTIVVDDKLISSIARGFIKVPDGSELIDLRGHTLMPGLMDMHVHFGQEYLSKSERPAKVERETSAILATQHALKTLKAGFTTVRQVGDRGMVAISLRDAINSGQLTGPSIFTSGKSYAFS